MPTLNHKTVPMRLAEQADNCALVARSQGKNLVAGLDKFDMLKFDFDGIETIGPSFADQIFRVFANHHPHIKITAVNTTPDVQQMINRALAAN